MIKTLKMTSFFGLFLAVVTQPFLELDAQAGNHLESTFIKRDCAVGLGTQTVVFQRMQDIWLTNKKSKYHFSSNLGELSKKHSEYFRQVEAFRSEFATEAIGLGQIEAQIKALDGRFSQLYHKLSEIVESDNQFINSTNQLHDALKRLLQNLGELKPRCGDLLEPAQSQLEQELGLWIDRLNQTQRYVALSHEKRAYFLGIVKESLRLGLEQAWATKAGESLANLHQRIQKILDALELQRNIQTWYYQFSVTSSLQVEKNQLLQYEKPLLKLASVYQQGNIYWNQLNSMKLENEMDKTIRNELDAYLKTIQSSIDELTSRGWKGTLERQQLLNSKRLSMLEKLLPDCKKYVDIYTEQAKKVTNFEEYRVAEELYVPIFSQCKLK